jgi:hypothetical protein
MDLNSYSPEQVSAFWAGVTAIAALITGVIAVVTLLAIRQDSRDRTRPVIVADLLPELFTPSTSELVVQNVGQSVAKEIRVTFEPAITEEMGELVAYVARRYSRVIPTMGPGRRLSNIYAHMKPGTGLADEDVPHHLVVDISYKDAHGYAYRDRYGLTLDTLLGETNSNPSNTDEAGMRRRLVRALEETARGVNRF